MRKIIINVILGIVATTTATAQPDNLRVNHLTRPLGVDGREIRMEWRTGMMEQQSFRVVVGTDSSCVAAGKGDSWDSKTRQSDKQTIYYGGRNLLPHTTYYWRVSVADTNGREENSAVSRFDTGVMGRWEGAWISDHNDMNHREAPYFRKAFGVSKKVKKARAYISAGGLFVLSINGRRVGDHFLDPVYTRYDRRNSYVTFDVTSMLRGGDNAVGVVLGNG